MAVHELWCDCGASMVVYAEGEISLLRIFCKKCRKVALETEKKDDGKKQIANKEQSTGGPVSKRITKGNRKFDHYIVQKLIGEGGMGKVYLAQDEKTENHVAIKVLDRPEDARALEYFIREVKVLRHLHHTNIVKLIAWGNYQGAPYFAMEYIDGKSLEQILAGGPISAKHACRIMVYILDALQYASQHKIIHRDIKPSNILINSKGLVKLIDLGVGKIMSGVHKSLTQTGQMIGTGYYMPAEQLQDAKRTDHRADIYAVGATLFHTLAGIAPFEEYDKNLHKILFAKIENKYIRLKKRNNKIPKELIKVVEKAMAGKPEERYQNFEEMKKELEKFLK